MVSEVTYQLLGKNISLNISFFCIVSFIIFSAKKIPDVFPPSLPEPCVGPTVCSNNKTKSSGSINVFAMFTYSGRFVKKRLMRAV